MNTALYNLLVYICLIFKGSPRLDKTQNDIHDTLVIICFVTLCVLAIIGFVALCFLIKPPEFYSTPLA